MNPGSDIRKMAAEVVSKLKVLTDKNAQQVEWLLLLAMAVSGSAFGAVPSLQQTESSRQGSGQRAALYCVCRAAEQH